MLARLLLQPMMGGGAPDIVLPSENLLAQWYAGNGSSVHSTISGSDGDPVTAWDDGGPSGFDVAQVTVSAQPTYHIKTAALNNRGSVEFDGDDFLHRDGMAAGIVVTLSVYSAYFVILALDTTDSFVYSEGLLASGLNHVGQRLHRFGGGRVEWEHTVAPQAEVAGDGSVDDGNAHVIVARRIASDNWSIRVDGTEVGTDTDAAGSAVLDQIALGAQHRNTTSLFYTGHLALCALYSADNFAIVEPIIADHYGITLS